MKHFRYLILTVFLVAFLATPALAFKPIKNGVPPCLGLSDIGNTVTNSQGTWLCLRLIMGPSGPRHFYYYDWVYFNDFEQDSAVAVVHSSPNGCGWLHSGMSTEPASGGYFETYFRALNPSGCTSDLPQPANEIKIQQWSQRYVSGSWVTCVPKLQYNSYTSAFWEVTTNYGTSPDCGSGYSYRNYSGGWFWQGGVWNGGYQATPGMTL